MPTGSFITLINPAEIYSPKFGQYISKSHTNYNETMNPTLKLLHFFFLTSFDFQYSNIWCYAPTQMSSSLNMGQFISFISLTLE